MVIGEDIAVGGQHEAGAGGGGFGNLAPDIGGGLVGDGHHGLHIHGIHLAGGQAALAGHGGAGDADTGLGLPQLTDLLLQAVKLGAYLLLIVLHAVFPLPVDHRGGDGAGAGHQRHREHSGQNLPAKAARLSLALLRDGICLGLGGIRSLIDRFSVRLRFGFRLRLFPEIVGGGGEKFLLSRSGPMPGGVLCFEDLVCGLFKIRQKHLWLLVIGFKQSIVVVFHDGSSLCFLRASIICIKYEQIMKSRQTMF